MDVKNNNRLAFIQNRCQICLYEKYNSLKNLQDFSWANVCKIIYFTNDPLICSICFGESIFPRMDRCGHLFCLSCILNFFEITKSERIPCPMCKDIKIDVNSFKRVKFCGYNIPKVGEMVEFKLMVKGNDNVCPRFADNLINFSDHKIPRKCSGIGKYVGVVVEKDFNAFESIRNDIIELKKRKSIFPARNFCQTMLHLTNEMEHFKNRIKIINREQFEDLKANNSNEKFNLLEIDKMKKNRFKLFYQSGFFHSVFLEETIQQEIIKKSIEMKEIIPVCVKGEIRSIRTVVIDNEFLQESGMNHLFPGEKITFLTVNLQDSSVGSIDKYRLKTLRSHQEELFKAEKEEEELRERVAKRAAETRYSRAPCRIVTSGTCDVGKQDIDLLKRKFENIVEGFNTCTLGIDCLVPDDDYPHAENCIHYRKDLLVSKENITEDKYFGLLRFKLNVFHRDEEASSIAEQIPNKNDVKRVVNYPPEIIDFNEFETPVKSNMMPYIVPRKPSSQFQQKQMRKMKKSVSKMSC